MDLKRVLASFVLLAVFFLGGPPAEGLIGSQVQAQESPPVGDRPAAGSIPGQEGEDIVQPLVPAKARTAKEQARVDALSWFATARILQGRGDLQGAYKSYKKALESDPEVLSIYRQVIPLALHLNQGADAYKWVQKATQLAPNDFEWWVQLAELQIRTDDLDGAIFSLEKAVSLPSMDPKSTPAIVLKHQLGQWYLAARRVADAAKVLEPVYAAVVDPQAYKINPQLRNQILANLTFEKFGEIFLDGGNAELALSAFRKAVEKRGSTTGDLSYFIAAALLKNKQAEQSLAELQKYLDGNRQSKRHSAYDLLGEVLKALGKDSELIAKLEQAAAKDTRNPYLGFALAEQYAKANQLDKAETLFKKTLAVSADARGYAGLAGVYRKRNQPEELLAALASSYGESGNVLAINGELKAVLGDKGLLDGVLKHGQQRLNNEAARLKFPAVQVLAYLAAESKQSDLAVAFFQFMLKIRDDRRKEIYQQYTSHLMEVRRFKQAAQVYLEAIQGSGNPDEREQLDYGRAYALAMDGNAQAALEIMKRLIDHNNKNPAYLFREAWILGHARQFEKSIAAYQRLLTEFPTIPQVQRLVRSGLSNVYVANGELKKGEEILEEVFRENPDDISINNDLGYLYADQGKNLEQAEKMIRKAVEAEPENGAYLDSLGWVLFRLGKAEEALPFIQQAVEKGQGVGDETLHEHLGDILDKLGRAADAMASWKTALEMAESSPYPEPSLIERLKRKVNSPDENRSKSPKVDPQAP